MSTPEAPRFVRSTMIGLMFCALLGIGRCLPAHAQERAAAALRTHISYSPLLQERVREDHSPRGALWRSAAFPGWGQVYNGQVYKLPFIYGAMGGLIYTAITRHDDYVLYRQAYQYKAFQELVDSGVREDNPRAHFKDAYDRIVSEFGPVSSTPLRVQRNNFRRTRDLSLIGSGVVYGLAMLDAYVSAHLLDFDIGDDLGIAVIPVPSGIRISARMRTVE